MQHAEASARASGDVSDRAEELNAAAKSANAAGAAIADEEKSFVTGSQARLGSLIIRFGTKMCIFRASRNLLSIIWISEYGLTNVVFVQEFERSRFAAMESEFRTRSDEAPEQMRKIQDKTRVSKLISLTVTKYSFVYKFGFYWTLS